MALSNSLLLSGRVFAVGVAVVAYDLLTLPGGGGLGCPRRRRQCAPDGAAGGLRGGSSVGGRQGVRPPQRVRPWTAKYGKWLDSLHFDRPEHEMLFAEYLRALDDAAERVDRLTHANLQASSTITRRRCAFPACRSAALRKRQARLPPKVNAISWKAQVRLHARFRRLVGRGKPENVAVVAVARELLAFACAIAQEVLSERVTVKPTA